MGIASWTSTKPKHPVGIASKTQHQKNNFKKKKIKKKFPPEKDPPTSERQIHRAQSATIFHATPGLADAEYPTDRFGRITS